MSKSLCRECTLDRLFPDPAQAFWQADLARIALRREFRGMAKRERTGSPYPGFVVELPKLHHCRLVVLQLRQEAPLRDGSSDGRWTVLAAEDHSSGVKMSFVRPVHCCSARAKPNPALCSTG